MDGSSIAISGTGVLWCLDWMCQLLTVPMEEVKNIGGDKSDCEERWMRLRVPVIWGSKERRERLKFTGHWLSGRKVSNPGFLQLLWLRCLEITYG